MQADNVNTNKEELIEDKKENSYSKWDAFLCLPLIPFLYPLKYVFKLFFGTTKHLSESTNRNKQYVKDIYGGTHETLQSKTVSFVNTALFFGLVYITYSAFFATYNVFNYLLNTPIVYILPFCLAGFASMFFSKSFSKFVDNNNKSMHIIAGLLSISFLISCYLAYDLHEQGIFNSGSEKGQDGFFSAILVPVFIFSATLFPLTLSLISSIVTIKDNLKNITILTTIGSVFALGFIPSYFQHSEVVHKENLIQQEKENKINKEKEKKQRKENYEKSKKEWIDNKIKNDIFIIPPQVASARYNLESEAAKDNSKLKGTGKGTLHLIPYAGDFRNVKIIISGIDYYEYGMKVPVGSYDVTISKEGFKTYKGTIEVKEGGNPFRIQLEKL